jgi:purine-binding chemotaxis protein CheW
MDALPNNVEQGLQLLTFMLDQEVFAVEISRVREVLEYQGVTKVPKVPDFMRGVINLRGSVVPVIDLKQKFGIGITERTISTCVIISEVDIDGERVVLGALADAVREVFDIGANDIEPPPRIGTRLDTAFIKGMGKYNDEFVIALDIDKIFSEGELRGLLDGGNSHIGADARITV